MIQIILDSEQEKLLQEQLQTGKYKTANEVITDALKVLSQTQNFNQAQSQTTAQTKVIAGETAQKLLRDKIKLIQETKKNYQPDIQRQILSEEFSKLCQETQELHTDNPLTEAEIAEEIAAYRRGE